MSQSENADVFEQLLQGQGRYARASAGERRSGPPTISMSGTPERLRSTAVAFANDRESICRHLLEVEPHDAALMMPRSGEEMTASAVASGWSNCEI